jgi:hypothetical protein
VAGANKLCSSFAVRISGVVLRFVLCRIHPTGVNLIHALFCSGSVLVSFHSYSAQVDCRNSS